MRRLCVVVATSNVLPLLLQSSYTRQQVVPRCGVVWRGRERERRKWESEYGTKGDESGARTYALVVVIPPSGGSLVVTDSESERAYLLKKPNSPVSSAYVA